MALYGHGTINGATTYAQCRAQHESEEYNKNGFIQASDIPLLFLDWEHNCPISKHRMIATKQNKETKRDDNSFVGLDGR